MAPPGISNSSNSRNGNDDQNGILNDNKTDSNLPDDIIVLDGGFATQLSCHVSQQIDGDVLWSARFLATDQEAVIDSHLDFLRAGADVIMTNSYQACLELFVKHLNLTKEESYNLIKKSVELAQIARNRFTEEFPNSRRPLIAGSIGPYGASLHDGSEYSGSYAKTTTVETMREWHIPRIRALIEGGVDILGLETIPCKAEAVMLVQLLKDQFSDMRAWLTFSCSQDGKTIAFGENFQEVAKYCYDLHPTKLVAVGVNCLAPRLVEPLLSGLNKDRKEAIPMIVYPNSGESYTVELGWINRDKCEPVETYVSKWLDLGVRWIGGCCRTYAADVHRIRREVEKWKQNHGAQLPASNNGPSTTSP